MGNQSRSCFLSELQHTVPPDSTTAKYAAGFVGGGTCSKCGAEVDKWGREVTAQRHAYRCGNVKPEDQMRKVLKGRLIVYSAVTVFCLTLLFAWLGIRPSVEQMLWKSWPLGMSI